MGNIEYKICFDFGKKQINKKYPFKVKLKLYGITQNKPELIKELKTSEECVTILLGPEYVKYEYFYVLADLRLCHCRKNSLTLLNVFSRYDRFIMLNEQTTVANLYCFVNLLNIGEYYCKDLYIDIRGSNDLINLAYKMRQNFVKSDGKISKVLSSNPNGLETNSYPMLNYLANLLYYGLTICKVYCKLLNITNTQSLIEAMFYIVKNPFKNVKSIYNLIKDLPPLYEPALNNIDLPFWKSEIPNQWTLTIKLNKTGSKNFIMGGPGYLIFDNNDRAWITNNVRQGTPNSSTFSTILESDGQPLYFSPLFGGGLLGGGFGVAHDKNKDQIAFGNFGWGSTDYNPQNGSVSLFESNGQILSPSNGYINGVSRIQGMIYDNSGNLWMTSWGSQEPLGFDINQGNKSTFDFKSSKSAITVYFNADPNNYAIYEFENEHYGTFDVVVDDENNVYVSNSGNIKNNVKSSIFHFKIIDNQIIKINSWTSDYEGNNGLVGFEGFRQIVINSRGYLFVAGVISSRVIKLDKKLNVITDFHKNIDGPWGIVFDNHNTMYVSNFKRDSEVVNNHTFDMKGPFGVTIIKDEDELNSEIATLPTGGSEVFLDNGFPLYGSNSKPSYEPLMRLTGSQIDRVGNVWAINNYKPALIKDFSGNPGGDGIVIFVGLANN